MVISNMAGKNMVILHYCRVIVALLLNYLGDPPIVS